MFEVFRVKNHDFTPKNHIFSNFRGGHAPGAPPPPGSAPEISTTYWGSILFFKVKGHYADEAKGTSNFPSF
jgi:hypothetical protein